MATGILATPITDDELDRMVESDPNDPGRHNARLTDHGHHVWAVIAYLHGSGGDIEATARAFTEGKTEAVLAAVRYYERNRVFIDAKILLENEANSA